MRHSKKSKNIASENVTNTGIRLTQDDTAFASGTFDSKYFGAVSIITLSNTTQDSSLTDVSGSFSVLVRRQRNYQVLVSIAAYPLTNGTYFLGYSLTNVSNPTSTPLTITNKKEVTSYLTTVESIVDGSIGHQNIFEYTIPANLNAPRGTYSANIVFTMTAG